MKRKARQREFGFTNWGGKRLGAGRKPKGERAGVSHAKRAKLAARFPVLVTMRLRSGLRSLRADDTHALLREAFAAGSRADFRVIEFSVQSNHLHVVAESSDERALARGGAWRALVPDVYSSAPWFEGWKGSNHEVAESNARSLQRARTWLLSIGWRRHGLIDPRETPVAA